MPYWRAVGIIFARSKTPAPRLRIWDVPADRGKAPSPRFAAGGRSAHGRERPDDSGLQELIGAVSRGDRCAFDGLYDKVAAPVFGLIRTVLRDPAQAEEVTQEVLVEIWRTAARYDSSKGTVMAWVSTMAHRRAIDRVRSEQKATDREFRALHGPTPDDVADTVETRLDHERVKRCMNALTELQREALTLAYYKGHSYREVAELLGLALGTVNTRMRDGLIRLRDCLEVER